MSFSSHAIVLAMGFILVEATVSAWAGLRRYDLRDTLANLVMGAGGLLMGAVGRVIGLPISLLIYELRIFELERTWWTAGLLIVAHDFCYYAFHRASHRVRLLWAAHVPHHSSTRYNLSTAVRLSWTTPLTGIPFWWPLPLLGFHPLWILGAHAASLGYQFLLHTELVGRLGPLEWVFNTPSHHRVHHGRDPEYLDKNFGGILIVWDRLFGTFAAERSRPEYGLVHPLTSHRPWTIAFHEWRAMIAAAVRPGLTLHQRARLVLGTPEVDVLASREAGPLGGMPSRFANCPAGPATRAPKAAKSQAAALGTSLATRRAQSVPRCAASPMPLAFAPRSVLQSRRLPTRSSGACGAGRTTAFLPG